MLDSASVLTVSLVDTDARGQEWKEQRLLSLGKELLEIESIRISPVRAEEKRPGAKNLDGALISLAVSIIANEFFLERLFSLLGDWTRRQKILKGVKVKVGDIEVEVPGSVSADEITDLIAKLKSQQLAKP